VSRTRDRYLPAGIGENLSVKTYTIPARERDAKSSGLIRDAAGSSQRAPDQIATDGSAVHACCRAITSR